jgi:ABC-2 type transport system permease protein
MLTVPRKRESSRSLRAAFEAAHAQYLASRRSPILLILTIVQPLVTLAIVFSRHSAVQGDHRTQTFIGIMLASFWACTVWSGGSIMRHEVALGTLYRNLICVPDPRAVLIGKCLGGAVVSMVVLTVISVILGPFFDLQLSPVGALLLIGCLILLLVSSGTIGMVLSSVFVVSRYAVYINNLLIYPIFIMGGLFIPLSYFPAPLRQVSAVVSLRWAAVVADGAVHNQFRPAAMCWLVLLDIAYGLLGLWTFRWVVRSARETGRLDVG